MPRTCWAAPICSSGASPRMLGSIVSVITVVVCGLCWVSSAQALVTPSVVIESKAVIFGQDPTGVAHVNGPSGASTPTGNVQFQIDGVNEGSPVLLDSDGRAVFHPSFLIDVGSFDHRQYNGDARCEAKCATAPLDVQPAATATSLTSSANPATAGGEVTIISTINQTTSVTSFGSVQFFVDGSPVLDRIPLNEDGQAGVVGRGLFPGDFAVTAAYHDDTAPIADLTDSQGGLTQHVVRPAAPAPPAPPPSAPPPTAQPPTAQAAIVSLLGGGHAKATAKGRKISVDPGEQAICPPAGPACSALVDATTQTAGKATSARRKPKHKTIAVGHAATTIAAGARPHHVHPQWPRRQATTRQQAPTTSAHHHRTRRQRCPHHPSNRQRRSGCPSRPTVRHNSAAAAS
jgi:hypothetical protein